ncbi:MAG: hypothetical protein DLM72_19195 [Candidatus Nitrosopolaris wilkensis]|nr:MAG: hypothetical protein DLM72_19195 [Candidatus Nitrosopolaris wilkensis]
MWNSIHLLAARYVYAKLCKFLWSDNKKLKCVLPPSRRRKVSFVDVRDIAAVAVQTLTSNDDSQHKGKAYTVTGGQALSYRQAAEILSKEVGKKIDYVNISDEDARKAMNGMGMEERFIDGMMELYNIIIAGHLSQTTNTVEQIIGRKPIPFEQFARDNVKTFN